MNVQEDCFDRYYSLTKYSNHEEALNLLKKLASHVKPIMKKRNWRVGTLEEFFPAEGGLLGVNVNHGAKIRIRLRPYYDDRKFYDFNDLIGTMLHELTHIEIGPHDARFYKLLDELNDEYDDLLAKGFSGEGFFGNGYRLGQGISHNVSPAIARQKALEAAEKRRKIEGLMTKGGRTLGGEERYGLSLRELTAMAAERRKRDNIWCGEGYKNGVNNNVVKKPIVGSSTTRPISAGRIPPNKIPGLSTSKPVRIPAEKIPGRNSGSWETAEWTCLQCTFINRPMTLQCNVCLVERPHEDDSSSFLPQPVTIIDDDNFSNQFNWSCPRCTFENAHDIIMCLGCDYLKN